MKRSYTSYYDNHVVIKDHTYTDGYRGTRYSGYMRKKHTIDPLNKLIEELDQ